MSELNKRRHSWCWLLAVVAVVAAIVPHLLQKGILLESDGFVIASMARNLSLGLGSFWHPYFATFHQGPVFDHPALATSSLSVLYGWFGDHVYIDKTVSVVVTVANIGLFYVLAKRFLPRLTAASAWIVVIAWLLVPANSWYAAALMLEPIANVFAMIAVCAVMVSYQFRSVGLKLYIWMLLAGICVCLGVYVNGLLVLYVWLLEPLLWLVFRSMRFHRHVYRWLLLVAITLLAFAAFVPAHHNFEVYWHQQVVATLLHHRVDSVYSGWNHLTILILVCRQVLIPLLVFAVLYCWLPIRTTQQARKNSLFWFLVFLVSICPIAVSSKQFVHYSLQGYPFFLLALLLLLVPALFDQLDSDRCLRRFIWLWRISLLSLLVLLFLLMAGLRSTSSQVMHETDFIIHRVGRGASVSIPQIKLVNPFLLEAYLQRLGRVNLKPEPVPTTPCLLDFLMKKNEHTFLGYQIVPESRSFRLARLYCKP